MGVLDRLLGRNTQQILEPVRSQPSLSLEAYMGLLQSFGFQGHTYTIPGAQQESPNGMYASVAELAYKTNGVVFACMLVRMMLFQEARFQFRRKRSGRTGELWGNANLKILETPWQGGTTGDMLGKAIQYADIGGNAFIVRRGNELSMLRPDWVDIVVGSNSGANVGVWDPDARAVAYVYWPGGKQSQKPPVTFDASEVAHFAPIPDPLAQFRGMSWLTPIFREIMADKAATDHKLSFFEKGATVNSVVKIDTPDLAKFTEWAELFREKHEGAGNAYKTLFLAAGMDYTPVGADMQQIDFKQVQGAGETRIAAAAGVPPVIVGLSEGLQAATYSNYGQARRRFADGTMSPLWRNMCGSLSRIIDVPSDSELAVDMRDIPFLKEDQKDAAEIQGKEASTIRQLVDAGFDPDTVVDAIVAGDLARLKGNHSGLYSVQLQPPGLPEPAPEPASNGLNSLRTIDDLLEDVLRQAERQRETHTHNNFIELPAQTVEIAEGAVQSHVTVESPTVEAARVEFADGAIRADVNVEPARVEFADGAVRVEPAPVTIADGAVRVTVEPSELRVEEGAIQSHVTVEPARVDVRADAPQVDVHVPAQEPPVVNVEARAADQLPPSVTVNVEPTPVQVDAPVTVNVPEQSAPDVNITLEAPNKKVRFTRDADGNIVEAKTEDAGA